MTAIERVKHRVSGQFGTVTSRGVWYAAVIFDGDRYPSCVAVDSIVKAAVGVGSPEPAKEKQ